MTNKILIINGVISTDELSKLGIDVAKEFQNADKVFIIDVRGIAKQVKYNYEESLSKVKYIDAGKIKEKIS